MRVSSKHVIRQYEDTQKWENKWRTGHTTETANS